MNVLVVKTEEGRLIAKFRKDQNYSDSSSIASKAVAELYPDESVSMYALVDAHALAVATRDGKLWKPGASEGDFGMAAKKDIPETETLIPPAGVSEEDLADTDPCLCYHT